MAREALKESWSSPARYSIRRDGVLAKIAGIFYIFVEMRIPVADTQISAHISEETKERLERYAGAHGVKKGALVEQALLHHLQALRELPADIIVPPRLELSQASFAKVAELAVKPRKPTKAMRALIGGKSGNHPDDP